MSVRKEVVEKLMNKLEDLQRQIDAIHNELLIELDKGKEKEFDELTDEEVKEIDAIRKKNNYKTFTEWEEEENK